MNKARRGTDPRTLRIDKAADWFITIGGLGIIAAVLGIFVFIFATIYPLIQGASGGLKKSFELPQGAPSRLAVVDEHKEKAMVIRGDGSAGVLSLADGAWAALPGLKAGGAKVESAWMSLGKGLLAFGLSNGKVALAEASYKTRFEADESRHQDAQFFPGPAKMLDPRGRPLIQVIRSLEDEPTLAGISADGRLLLSRKGRLAVLALPKGAGRPSALLLRHTGEVLLAGTRTGELHEFDLRGEGPAYVKALKPLPDGEGVSALAWPIGEQSILVGGSRGTLVGLARLQKGEETSYPLFHRFESMAAAVSGISVSQRDKGFTASAEDGSLRLFYLTGERTVLDLALPKGAGPAAAFMTPKANGLFALSASGAHLYDLHNPHPETTLRTLFGKVWYEGYEGPDYVWQSTGGSDDFESKFSLTPLIYGTLKGTFYALLFAVPLAILAALYVSQFMSRRLKAYVKPAIEIMAALPSVVMGFLAALLLAPWVERHLFSITLGAVLAPAFVMATLALWRGLPERLTKKLNEENELWVLVAGLFLGFLAVGLFGQGIERAVFNDFKVWLSGTFGVSYDQRNSLVVGFAMGFAVIPIIFTICEDALSSVPRHLISASLSCGATPWQTSVRVVLPVALSGIFSAVMIGFGRAVGETMIVLMATGNTAVMDFSMFNGFRALSANIAVEIPEAPLGGTLYRVLFLAALVLFTMTFLVNTVAELIRLHLRRKYSQL